MKLVVYVFILTTWAAAMVIHGPTYVAPYHNWHEPANFHDYQDCGDLCIEPLP